MFVQFDHQYRDGTQETALCTPRQRQAEEQVVWDAANSCFLHPDRGSVYGDSSNRTERGKAAKFDFLQVMNFTLRHMGRGFFDRIACSLAFHEDDGMA